MKNMCAECGADLQTEMSIVPSAKVSAEASISIVHSIPELKVSSNVRNISTAVWKFQDFSVTKILREINFGQFISCKTMYQFLQFQGL